MLADGALEGVAAALSLHVDGGLDTGRITVGSGYVNAACDDFTVRILGRGGHAAHPDQTVDPIWIASQVLAALYTIPSRRLDPPAAACCRWASSAGARRRTSSPPPWCWGGPSAVATRTPGPS